MPPLVNFMLTRLAAGFAIGAAVGLAIWSNTIAPAFPSSGYVAQGLFIYQFASTIGVCYLATALMLDDC